MSSPLRKRKRTEEPSTASNTVATEDTQAPKQVDDGLTEEDASRLMQLQVSKVIFFTNSCPKEQSRATATKTTAINARYGPKAMPVEYFTFSRSTSKIRRVLVQVFVRVPKSIPSSKPSDIQFLT
jgi:hypothetical protein